MPTALIIGAVVAVLVVLLATASYKVCPANKVMVITGPGGRRFVSGGSAFIIPFIMRVDWLSLGAVQSLLSTDTAIPTKDAILIDVNAVANFQIASETTTVDENGKQVKHWRTPPRTISTSPRSAWRRTSLRCSSASFARSSARPS